MLCVMQIRNLKTLAILPERLVAARGLMPQAEAARELGISPQHLGQIERGKQRCPAHILLRMVILYKVSDPLRLAGEQKIFVDA